MTNETMIFYLCCKHSEDRIKKKILNKTYIRKFLNKKIIDIWKLLPLSYIYIPIKTFFKSKTDVLIVNHMSLVPKTLFKNHSKSLKYNMVVQRF